jgi:hypothetical protein
VVVKKLSESEGDIGKQPVSPLVSSPDHIERMNRFFAHIGTWSFDHRWWVVAAGLLVFVSSMIWASRAHVDMTFDAFFEASDPTYTAYKQYREDYGSDEVSYILYEVPDAEHGPFDIEAMRKIAQLTEEIEQQVPFVEKVTSLANVEIMEAVEDGITIHELLLEFPASQRELLTVRELVLDKPTLVGGLLSEDAKFAAIIVKMEKSSIDPPDELKLNPDGSDWIDNLYPQVSDEVIENLLASPEYAGIAFYHGGDVPWNANYNRILVPQTLVTVTATYLLIGILLFAFFRRARSVIGPFIVVSISIAISAALVGIMGWDLDLMFPFVPSLLIAIGVADSVHIISGFNRYYKKLGDRREAVRQTMYHIGTPCLLTSLTTAAGLLAMSFSNVKSMAHLAIYSAGGIMAAFLLSVTLLMTFFAFRERGEKKLPPQVPEPGQVSLLVRLLATIAAFDIRHPKLIIAVSAVIVVFSIAGTTRLRVDSTFMEEWREDEPIRQISMKIDDIMGGMGMSSVVYLFDSGEAEGVKNPALLQEIERVQTAADNYTPYVKKTISVVDVIKDLNRTFHDNDPAYYRIPDDREMIAQLLLVYEMSGGENLEDYVSGDLSRANLEVLCHNDAISEMKKLADHIAVSLEQQPLQVSRLEITGIGALWMQFADYIAESQIQGILLAFSVIAIMMCVIFRSLKIGLLSMIPNLSPVLLTLGYMGWVGMELDYTRLLIAPLAIGIAVDDTIHMVTRFHVEFRRLGNYAMALENCIHCVGHALIGTTVILMAGFLVNVFHGMETQVIFGELIAWAIFVALVADLLLMPALILVFKPFGPETVSSGVQIAGNERENGKGFLLERGLE